MLFKEMIGVHCGNRMKPSTVCGQIAEFVNISASDTYRYHCLLNVKSPSTDLCFDKMWTLSCAHASSLTGAVTDFRVSVPFLHAESAVSHDRGKN
jgi:hypothetical protein